MRAGQVRSDLAYGRTLGAGELEGQLGMEATHEVALYDVTDALGLALGGPLAQDQRQLQAEQLVEHQPSASGLGGGHRLGSVDAVERLGPFHQSQALPPTSGQRFGERSGALQGLRHPAAYLPGHQPRDLRLGVDGHDAAGAVPHQVDDRVGHLAPAPVRLDLAEQHRLGAHRQLAGSPRLVEEDGPEVAGPVGQVDLHQRPTLAGAAGAHLPHPGQHQSLVPRSKIAQAGLAGPVEVAPRIVRQQVQHGVDPDGGQGFGLLGPDPGQLPDGDVGQLGQAPPSRAGQHLGARAQLLDAEQVGRDRMPPVLHLEGHRLVVLGQPRADALGVRL
jgi:hypothetical protein